MFHYIFFHLALLCCSQHNQKVSQPTNGPLIKKANNHSSANTNSVSLHSRPVYNCLTYDKPDCADLHPYARSLCQYGIMQKFDSQFRHRHLVVNTELALGPQASLNWAHPNNFRWSVQVGRPMVKRSTETKLTRRKLESDVCPVVGAEVVGGREVLFIGLLWPHWSRHKLFIESQTACFLWNYLPPPFVFFVSLAPLVLVWNN